MTHPFDSSLRMSTLYKAIFADVLIRLYGLRRGYRITYKKSQIVI